MYLLDTNIIIDFLRTRMGIGETLFDRLMLTRNDLAISTITISELYAGKSTLNKEKAKEIDNLKLDGGLKTVNFTAVIAKLTGCVIRDSKGDISFTDAAIAATAIYKKMPLITYNAKHFVGINGLEIINPKG